ncbi:MAG: hypothetical protein F4Y14_16945 [Acidobacteria bacterium]|nr:hypothetical protein [Acidobacteriota bacterium]
MKTTTDPTPSPPLVPDTLTVVLIDDTPNYVAIVHENEWRPYARRTVQIRLTDEQRRQLAPRATGMIHGKQQHEQVLQAWLEPATQPLGNDAA